MDWKAKWIWDGSGEHPENHWACFRRTFELDGDIRDATLKITADSRYTVYINGSRIGSGPVRNWTFELPYDSYPVGDELKKGRNVIAVLVNHYGEGTFQYIEGRGGLLAQLDIQMVDKAGECIYTDNRWVTSLHAGFKQNVPLVNVRLSWAEVYDANNFDADWNAAAFDDRAWKCAEIIGETGMPPWNKLVERDIPYLTDETVYPRRILSSSIVRPIRQAISLDIRHSIYFEEYDINCRAFLGFLTVIIDAPEEMEGDFILYFCPRTKLYGDIRLNGKILTYKDGPIYRVRLEKGENLLIADISGIFRDTGVHLGFDFEKDVALRAPINGIGSRFAFIGPLEIYTHHYITANKPGCVGDSHLQDTPQYRALKEVTSIAELAEYVSLIKPVQLEHIFTDDVLTMSIYKKKNRSLNVTYDMQNMVIPNRSFTRVEPCSNGDVEYIVDFGEEFSGYIEFDIDAPRGTIFDFYMFESMHDGIIEHTYGTNNTLRYVASEGRQSYRSQLRRGLKYMMLTVRRFDRPVKIYSIGVNQSNYPMAEVGEFKCSDYLLNRIWEISRHTTRLCMEDTFVDCPTYEQTFWVGDSRNESLISYYTFGAYDIVKRCLRLVTRSMERSPLPESHVPSGWQNILTDWALMWMTACDEYYNYIGDTGFLEEVYPSVYKAAQNSMKFINNNGLLEITAWNMLDWAPMDTPDEGIVTHQNAFLVRALESTAHTASVLGRSEDENTFRGYAESLRKAINEHLWDDNRKAYIDSIHKDGGRSCTLSLQTNLVVYLCGCASEERKPVLEKYLLDPPAEFLTINSPFVNFFYYEALTKLGRLERAVDDMRKVWGNMLEHGATTCWEGWNLIPGYLTRSHCHAWSAAPGYFLGAFVLGVRPLEPGFARIIVEPKLCGLEWVQGSVPIPQGRVDVSVRKQEDRLVIRVDAPEGTKVEILPPEVNSLIYLGEVI